MSHSTSWIVVDLSTGMALTPESNPYHSLVFVTKESAQEYADRWNMKLLVVGVKL